MARVKYFSGSVELDIIEAAKDAEFSLLFPGVVGRRTLSGEKYIGLPVGQVRTYDRENKKWSRIGFLPVERVITYKSNPSRHECDARCMNASGRTMQCECSCGGMNHGKSASLSCF